MGLKYNKVKWNSNEDKTFANLCRFIEFNSSLGHPYTEHGLNNTFIVFTSLESITALIYANINLSIISYNLNDNKRIIEIKKAHKTEISNFRHYLDKNNKRDLIISISAEDNNLKLWNYNNFECLINLDKIYSDGFLNSACFLSNKTQIYILTGNSNYQINKNKIKVYNINGKAIKEINNSDQNIFFIDSYYDKDMGTNFIITPNESYFFEKNKIYKTYYSDTKDKTSAIIFNDDKLKITKLISSCASWQGFIKIFNFHSGILLNEIKIIDRIYGICLWNKNNIFVGCQDHIIRLLDINKGVVVENKNLYGHNYSICSIKKIHHPKFGECLISQDKEKIELWINNKYLNEL